MGFGRSTLLWISENRWMREKIPNLRFVQKAVKRFIPGEELNDALKEALKYEQFGITNVFTHLGENITNLSEAKVVVNSYLEALEEIHNHNLNTEISLKLTQIGFDLSIEETANNFETILRKAADLNISVWIDMEQSDYVDKTLDFYKKMKSKYQNVGICLQAYLYRTEDDINSLMEFEPKIRLVKGAYMEPSEVAFPQKSKVDENFYKLSALMLDKLSTKNIRIAFATHDVVLINRIKNYCQEQNIEKNNFEFQMLFGIKTTEQLAMVRDRYKIIVLISYGNAWFPWYMRRLAERPANIGFVIKNIFTN
ncbi:MAG: proline dehydrogenase family protein [Melioribacteraceae bacterium]|nr:proline dehydrogenase family protein [Melioribacteraceae bacterium]MCF8265472.1 proline dehydrogenase family protein [Melioribacteraceae bacterium]MCF8431109.1 proline dehydrogenase family protein [Melioribacteraceae bacterium]